MSKTSNFRLFKFIVTMVILAVHCLSGQSQSTVKLPSNLMSSSDVKLNEPSNNLYMQVNKDFYLLGEHIWFNLYASEPFKLDQGIVKLDLVSPDGEIVNQQFINIDVNTGNGAILLNKEIGPGVYRIYVTNEHIGVRRKLVQKFPVYPMYVDDLPKTGGIKYPAEGTISFFPEGGVLIQNTLNKVVITRKNHLGLQEPVEGSIYSENNVKVADIISDEKGFGMIEFLPGEGQYYFAKDTMQGSAKFYLPLARNLEFGINYAANIKGYHSFNVFNLATQQGQDSNTDLILIGVNDENLVYKHRFILKAGAKNQIIVPFGDLPHGIVDFGLFTKDGRVLGQRAIFNKKLESIQINASLDKKTYKNGDLVSLKLETLDQLNKPIPANLSIRVLNQKFNDIKNHKQHDILDAFYFKAKLNKSDGLDDDRINDWLISRTKSIQAWNKVFNGQDSQFDNQGKVAQIINRIKYLKNNEMKGMARISIFFVEAHVIEEFYFDEIDELNTVLRDVLGRNHLFIYAFDWKGDRIGQIKFNENLQDNDIKYPAINENLVYQDAVEDYIEFKKKQNLVGLVYDLPSPSSSIRADVVQFEWSIPDYVSNLKEFNTLPSMKETLRGVVSKTHVKKDKGGDRIYLSPKISSFKYSDSPLILINNIPTYSDSIALSLDPKNIAEISVRNSIRTQSEFGTFGSKGILSITLKKDVENPLSAQINLLPIMEGINPPVRYDAFRPRSSEDKIPDFRPMLYWNSEVRTDESGKAVIEFDNSDLSANYIIYIEGLSEQNEPGSKTIKYEVLND